jgi:3-mercaptopyruvate sulfurtransferase SseA
MSVPRISVEDLKTRLDSPDTAPIIVDARLKYPYEHSTVTLPGAIRMHPEAPAPSQLPAGRDVVAYDSDPDELASERLALRLIRQGHRVSVLEGGIGGWLAAKLPVDAKVSLQPVQPKPKPDAAKS